MMNIKNGQSAAKPLIEQSNEESSTTIPEGSTGDNLGKGDYYDNKKVKIYTLEHPITKEIRYIGKTTYSLEQRLAKHLVTNERNHRANWIKSLLSNNLKPVIKLLDEVDIENWKIFEIYWIAQFKAWGFRLVNLTEGGESGIISDKCRLACIKTNTGRISPKRGIKLPIEVRLKISNKLKGRKIPKEVLEKRSKTRIGRNISEKTKKKIGEANSIKIDKFDLLGNYIETYLSMSEASKKNNIALSSISKCCNDLRRNSKGFIWKYHNKDIV